MNRFKRGLAILLSTCMIGGMMPLPASAEETVSENIVQTECIENTENLENAPSEDEKSSETDHETGSETESETVTDAETEGTAISAIQALIDALPDADSITEDNVENVTSQLDTIDEAKAELSDADMSQLDLTRYDAAINKVMVLMGMKEENDSEIAVQANDSAGKTEQQSTEEEECKHEGIEITFNSNGFGNCPKCNATVYQPAVETTDKYDIDDDSTKDTVYEISNAGQLYWFAGLVNGTLDGVEQNTLANAILTANITVNENLLDSLQYDTEGNVSNGSDFITWTPIADWMGNRTTQYSGTFDGNNKIVSGLYFNGDSTCIGLFGSSESDGNIKNVGVVDSYFKGNDHVGGVCGNNAGTITNCYNAGNLTAIESSATVGGICGYNNGGTVTNCYNTGTVTATGSVASVGGVCGCSIAPISNCYNIGTVTATSSSADISGICGYYFGPIKNCYYLADTEDENGGKTAAQFASGEIAYLLSLGCSTGEGDNTVTYDGSIWGQTIGTDIYPTLDGAKVYKNAIYEGCEGKPGEPVSYEYSNTEKNTYGDHPDADNDGKCDDCGQYIDGIGAKLAGYSLSLTGNIGVNFYMELSNDIVSDESAYMNFILPNGTTSKVYVSGTHEDGSTATTDTTVKNGVTYYVFTCEVAAKEMTSDIKAQMIGNNGEKKGTVHTYTVKEYADYILSHMSAEESDISKATIQLVKGMLNYGGAAQKYFGYKTDQLASDGLTLTGTVFNDTSIINNITNEANKASVTCANAKVTFKSAYLSLNSTTDLCVSVQFADDVTVKEDMFAIWCNTDQISKDQYEVTKVNEENCYKITLHGVKASQLNEKYAFYVELSDTEYAELAYGTNSYAYTVMSSACDNINNIESLREVVKALYAYGSCAQGYEHYKNDGNN